MSVFIIPPPNLHNLCKKSLGRSLAANSSRSRSSRKFVCRASCIHRHHTDSQTARQVDRQTGRQTDTQTYGDLINWGEITLQVCCPGILVYLFLWLLSCKFLWGADEVNPLAQWFTWEGAPCQVGTRSVKLAGLSSKSTCNSLLHLEFRVQVWLLHSCV